MSVGGVTVDPDDELGCCSLDLSQIEGDFFDGWLDLKNIAHGKLHVRAERFKPSDSQELQKNLKTDEKAVQMTQIWINELQSKTRFSLASHEIMQSTFFNPDFRYRHNYRGLQE